MSGWFSCSKCFNCYVHINTNRAIMRHVVNLSVSRQKKIARYVRGAYLAREFHGSYCSGLISKSGINTTYLLTMHN